MISTQNNNSASAVPKTAQQEQGRTRDKLSKLAGVGHDTYSKGVDILKSDNEKLKQEYLKQ